MKDEFVRTDKARWRRNAVARKYVEDMMAFNSGCTYMITFTFDDDAFEYRFKKSKACKARKEASPMQAMKRWLERNTLDYFGGKDYGGRNGRLHFHFVLVPNFQFNKKGRYKYDLPEEARWRYGIVRIRKTYGGDKGLVYAAKYAVKAASYSTKAGERSHLMKKYKKRSDRDILLCDDNRLIPVNLKEEELPF